MTTYQFQQYPAIDESGEPARDATGLIYATDDLARANPLPVTDLAGVPMTNLTTDRLGLIPPFAVEGHKIVVFKSGTHESLLVSVTGIIADLEAALLQVTQARQSAEQAAGLVGAPSTVAVTTMLTTPGNTAYDAVVDLIEEHGGSGGGGDAQAENLEAIRRWDPDTQTWPPAARGNFTRIVWEGPADVDTPPVGPDGAQPGDIRRRLVEA